MLASLALIAAATLIAVPLLHPHLSPQFGALSMVGGLLTATACAAAFLANRRYAVAAAALQQRDASARSLIELDSRPAFDGSKISISGPETAQHNAWELAHDLEHAYRTGRIAPLTIEPRSLTWTTSALGCEFLGIDMPRARPLGDFFSLVEPEDREQVQGALEGARVAGTRHVIEFRLARPIDGTARHLRLDAETIAGRDGDPAKPCCTLRDITREQYPLQEIKTPGEIVEGRVKQRTAELAGVNDALETLAASIAHELRTPLRTINGFAHLLRLDAKAGKLASLDFLAERIITNGELMGNLLDNLLVLARASHDGLASEPVDMAAMIADVLGTLEARTRATITVAALPTMQADPSLMRMALSNLISNALKYSRKHEHPTIVVDCSQTASEVVFSVRDNGVGFDPAHTDRLFGTFQRLHGKSEFEGTGIGLAIVRRVIELHDGRVWAEGKPDHGATFHFALPAYRIARRSHEFNEAR